MHGYDRWTGGGSELVDCLGFVLAVNPVDRSGDDSGERHERVAVDAGSERSVKL